MLKLKRYCLLCLILVAAVFSALSFAADDNRQAPDIRTFTGQLQILIADNFDTSVSERRYAIRVQQAAGGYRYLPLSFVSIPPSILRTGDRVVVEGRLLDDTIVVYSLEQELDTMAGRIESAGYAPLTIGDRNAVVLIVNMNDAQSAYRTSDLAAMMYTYEKNVNGLYQASSGRQLSFVPDTDGDGEFDVFGPLAIDHSANENCTLNTRTKLISIATRVMGPSAPPISSIWSKAILRLRILKMGLQ